MLTMNNEKIRLVLDFYFYLTVVFFAEVGLFGPLSILPFMSAEAKVSVLLILSKKSFYQV